MTCKAFDHHIKIGGGYIDPCCRFNRDLSPEFSFPIDKIDNILHSTEYETARKKLPKGCESCILEEKNTGSSLRTRFNERLTGPKKTITYLELSLNNTCNLACRMCNIRSSSLLEKEFNNLGEDFKKQFSSNPIQTHFSWHQFKHFFKNLNRLKYLGGEPFLTPEFIEILNYLNENDYAKNITLIVYSNATIPPKNIDLLKNFRQVLLTFSVDGFGKTNEYIRFPSKWEKIDRNLHLWKEQKPNNLDLTVSSVIQHYNAYDIWRLEEYLEKMNLPWYAYTIYSPDWLDLSTVKGTIKIKPKKYYKLLDLPKFNKQSYLRFLRYTKTLDKKRNTEAGEFLPELWEIIKKDYKKVSIVG